MFRKKTVPLFDTLQQSTFALHCFGILLAKFWRKQSAGKQNYALKIKFFQNSVKCIYKHKKSYYNYNAEEGYLFEKRHC